MELRYAENIQEICDHIELWILIWSENFLNRSSVKNILERNVWNSNENIVSDIFNILEERLELYWERKPYTIEWETIISNFQSCMDKIDYTFCLLLNRKAFDIWEYNAVWKLFERLTWEALAWFFWECWKYKVFWFPNEKEKVEELAKEIDEGFIQEIPANRKDRWLDVVSWKNIDNRKSKFVILNQSTSGIKWKSDKPSQLNIEAWCKYINFTMIPIKSFSFPNIYVGDMKELSYDWWLIIDRVRIYNLVNSYIDKNLEEDIKKWIKKEIINLE